MTPQGNQGQPLQGMPPIGMSGNGGGEPMQAPPGPPGPNPMTPPQEGGEEYNETSEQEQMENIVNSALSMINIAKKLRNRKDKESDTLILNKIGNEVVDGYENDEDSRSEWMKMNVDWMSMALLKRDVKTFPWPRASNVKYPLLSTAAMQFSARAYPALVPSDGKIVKTRAIPYDPQGKIAERAEHISRHMSYQILCKMPGWERDMDKLLMAMAISGICFKKTYHDPVMGVHRSDLVYPENLVVNYWAKDLESAYRKTEIQYFTDNEIREKVSNDEEFLDLDFTKSDLRDSKNRNIVKKISTGNEAPPLDKATPHKFLDCHTFWDLDGDGYEEPYIITVHADTKQVVRIIARWDLDGMKHNDKGKIVKIEPLEYFTAFPFIPNPDGSIYALGFGLLLGPLNESVNSIINQLIDSGTISNMQSGFIGKGLRMKMGLSTFQPGEWKVVNATGDDLRKSIVPLPSKDPSSVLMSLLQMLITSGNQLASIAEIFVGKMPGQNTPATTTQETVKQGMAVFTAIYKRVYNALECEFKKIFRLNAITEGIVEEENKILGLQLSSSDYDDDNYIIPGGDPTGDSESTKLAKVQQVGQMLQLGTIDPMAYTTWALQIGEIPNYQALIKQPAPPPQPDPTEVAKQQTEQLKQQGLQQKMQGDQQKSMVDIQTAGMLAQIKAEGMKQEVAFKQTMQAMEMQGKKMDSMMNMVEKVLEQRHQAAMASIDIQNIEVKNKQALDHAEQQNKKKLQQPAGGKR